MNIHKICSSSTRIKILKTILYDDTLHSVSKTAAELRISKGLVSAYFSILNKEGILRRVGRKFCIQHTTLTRALKIMLNVTFLNTDIFRRYSFVKGVGIYGSMAKGTNTKDSDIDLWIMTKPISEENLAKLTRVIMKFGNIKPLYLTQDKLEILKKNDQLFYHALLFGSITIYGDELET